jgi:uncharacterized delta-60 repeat protein
MSRLLSRYSNRALALVSKAIGRNAAKRFAALALLLVGAVSHAQNPPSFFVAPSVTAGQGVSFSALQPNEQVLAANGTLRYNADGSQDSSFSLGVVGTQVEVDSTSRIIVLGSSLTQCNSDGGVNLVLYSNAGNISGFVIQPDNKVIVFGSNRSNLTFGSVSRAGIARINTDGSLDTTFDPGFGPLAPTPTGYVTITGVAIQTDGKLIVTGNFTTFDKTAAPGVIRLNSDGTVDSTFQAASVSHPGVAIELPNGNVAVVNGSNFVCLNSDGSLNAILSTNGGLDAVALQQDGKLLVGGNFSSFANQPAVNLVRLNSDLSIDSSFNAAPTEANLLNSIVTKLAVTSTGLIYQGFGSGLMRLTSNGAPDPNFAPGPSLPGQVIAVARGTSGQTFIAGTFTAVNGIPCLGVASLLADGSVDSTFTPSSGVTWIEPSAIPENPSLTASIAVLSDGSLLLAGTFNAVGSVGQSGVVHFLSNGTADSAFDPLLNSAGSISSVVGLPNGLWVIGGNFSSVNSSPRGNLAAFSTGGSQLDPSFGVNSGTNGPVTILQNRPSGGLYMGGIFSLVGSLADTSRRNSIAALNADGSLDSSFDASVIGDGTSVTAIAPIADGRAMVSASTGLFRLTAAGATDAIFSMPVFTPTTTPISSAVSGLAVDGEGRAYASIVQTYVPGRTEIGSQWEVYRFNLAGAIDTTFVGTAVSLENREVPGSGFQAPATPSVSMAIAPDGLLAIGGDFTGFDGETAPGLVLIPDADNSIPIAAPVISNLGPSPTVSVYLGSSATLSVTTMGTLLAYQWQFNGAPISGATQATLTLSNFQSQEAGAYTVVVINSGGSVTSSPIQVSVGASRIVNLSARANVGTGANILIAGFVIQGAGTKSVLLRGVGPTLATAPFDVPGVLTQPELTLVISNPDGGIGSTQTNTVWGGTQALINAFVQVGAFALPSASDDSAILTSLPAGAFTSQLSGLDSTTGVALAEIYDADVGTPTANLVNISARANVSGGAGVLIAGFIIDGTQPIQVLLRGVGPALAPFGVSGPLQQPTIGLYDSANNLVESGTGWGNALVSGSLVANGFFRQATASDMIEVGAFPLPNGSADCAMVATLPPGAYTVELGGINGSTGVGLVEVYLLQ